MFSYSLIFASYAPVPLFEEMNTFKDEALVQLAYSQPLYDNIGMLHVSITNDITGITLSGRLSSAIYIGGKICLTSAHCECKPFKYSLESVTINYKIAFEIAGQEKKHYKVKKFISHLEYEQNDEYDLAVLILEEPVAGSTGLRISDEFSKSEKYEDEEHLLTYVGYGAKILDDHYFLMLDDKRRALRAYTQEHSLRKTNLRIYSTPYGQYNWSTKSRSLVDYEAGSRGGMSGGAVINSNGELVGIIYGTQFSDCFTWQQSLPDLVANVVASVLNIIPLTINVCCCPMPFLASFPLSSSPGTRKRSVPLAPFKAWIEEIRSQYEDTHHMDHV